MRKSGVLMHLSSLPGAEGIGTMGKSAYEFVDFLSNAGQSVWQLLPVGPTSYGDSPYAAYSTFAGNPYFIDLELLEEQGLLKPEEYKAIVWSEDDGRVDYGRLYENRYPVLQRAVERLLEKRPEDYDEFIRQNEDWLPDYALFMALKHKNDGRGWQEWPEEEKVYSKQMAARKREELREEVDFWEGMQYLFFKQWNDLRKYANDKGVEIIGDLPIYVALDGVDAWSNPYLFQLDDQRRPTAVAGCPPDAFSEDGQLWGNPLYDWEHHRKTGYEWWLRRFRFLTKLYNIVRIDHFRGFDSYYSIPYGAKNAKVGEWKQGPGMDLFNEVKKIVPEGKIIAEDLGFLTDSVKQLLQDTGYPGMKILEFAFDPRDASSADYLPYKYPANSVAYCGTHDNQTVKGWLESQPEEIVEFAREYLRSTKDEDFTWDMIAELLSSPSNLAIVQAQDLLNLGDESRMNTPSTVGTNWTWRAPEGAFDKELAKKLNRMTEIYGRKPEKPCKDKA